MMDQDPASADLWTMDKLLLRPGVAVDLLNQRSIRETELLRKISDLTDEIRALKAPKPPAPAPAKTIEDYAMAAISGIVAFPGPIGGKMNKSPDLLAKVTFDIAHQMMNQAKGKRS